ncbi:MAG: mitochondrial Homoaconitase, partial [Trichoglossum hirsutum]
LSSDRSREKLWELGVNTELSMFGKGIFPTTRWDDLLYADPVQAGPGAYYAKQLYLNLSTLSPYVSGSNSVKVSAL